jgi:hypothetical protein
MGVLPAYRARVNFGLRTRPLGTITYQVTGGDDATDTFDVLAGSTSLLAAPVEWTTSHAATAEDIADAINANYANHNYLATVSSDTVTIMQRKSGAAPTFSVTEVNDAAGTLANSGDMSNDTDTWTEFVSGATFDGNLYYEISWAGSLLAIEDVNTDNARAVDLDCYCGGQAVTFWVGGLRTASNAIVQGIPLATATWYHATFGDYLPIMDTSFPVIIKVASDEELLYSVGVI